MPYPIDYSKQVGSSHVQPIKTLFHLIAAIIMAAVVLYALQPDTKRLVFSAPGFKLETK